MNMATAIQEGTDAAPDAAAAPVRRCLASGESRPRAQLIRFVCGPDDTVVPDLAGRLPGRGLWVTCHRDMVGTACERNLFSRAARRAVTPVAGPRGEATAEWVEALLQRRAIDTLAMARKAGRFVFGKARVGEALERLAPRGTEPGILFLARDAGNDGHAVSRRFAAASRVPLVVIETFDAFELGRVAGRDNVVHALVPPGGTARQARRAAVRLAVYRGELPLDALLSDPSDEESAGAADDDVTDE